MGRLNVTALAVALSIGAATQQPHQPHHTYSLKNDDNRWTKRKENWQGNGKRKKPKGR